MGEANIGALFVLFRDQINLPVLAAGMVAVEPFAPMELQRLTGSPQALFAFYVVLVHRPWASLGEPSKWLCEAVRFGVLSCWLAKDSNARLVHIIRREARLLWNSAHGASEHRDAREISLNSILLTPGASKEGAAFVERFIP